MDEYDEDDYTERPRVGRAVALMAGALVACALVFVGCGGAEVRVTIECPRTCVQTGDIATADPASAATTTVPPAPR